MRCVLCEGVSHGWRHLETSGSIWEASGRHLEASRSIWRYLEASGWHLGGIWEASGGIWEASGLLDGGWTVPRQRAAGGLDTAWSVLWPQESGRKLR